MTEFFQTKMGQDFYQGTMPRIAKALERIADTLENKKLEKKCSRCNGIGIFTPVDLETYSKSRRVEIDGQIFIKCDCTK